MESHKKRKQARNLEQLESITQETEEYGFSWEGMKPISHRNEKNLPSADQRNDQHTLIIRVNQDITQTVDKAGEIGTSSVSRSQTRFEGTLECNAPQHNTDSVGFPHLPHLHHHHLNAQRSPTMKPTTQLQHLHYVSDSDTLSERSMDRAPISASMTQLHSTNVTMGNHDFDAAPGGK